MACCDTCPFTPDCEEMADFLEDIGLMSREWAEDHAAPDGAE